MHADNNTTTLCESNEKIACQVASFINQLHSALPELSPQNIICYLNQCNVDYECKPYVGSVLVQDYHINPFELYAIVNEDEFWNIQHVFKDSFVVLPCASNEQIITAVENIFSIASGDMANGIIGTSMAAFFMSKSAQLEELFATFKDKPMPSMMWFLCYAADYLALSSIELTNKYLQSFIKSNQPILMQVGVQMSKNLAYNYWSVIQRNTQIIIDALINVADNNKFNEFTATAISYIYQIDCGFHQQKNTDSYFQLIYDIIVSKSDLIKYSLLQEIFNKVYGTPEAYSVKDKKYISALSNTVVGDNKGLIDSLDMLIKWQIEHNKERDAWSNIESFVSANPKIKLSNALDSVCNIILNKIEAFLPHIYQNIKDAKNTHSAGLQLFEIFSFQHTESISSVNWIYGINDTDVMQIARKVFVSCINPEFVSLWGATLICSKLTEKSKSFIELYKELVCENYPMTTHKNVQKYISDDIPNKNEFEKLYSFCSNIINERDRISQIKDFSSPYSRLLAYRTEQAKQNIRFSKLCESNSVLLNFVSKVNIKYGVRSAFIQSYGNEQVLKESELVHLERSIEMPRLFISDPLFLYICMNEAFAEVDEL